ncbi:sulfate/molybdate ABC transporter ATP-binding protein [Hyphomicrobium sp.]|jgi:sulfate transport system ATP-binding protein|uniref:sulfate/molybdate ABC transporter ATP-binding protein n=1 Tax=Hyphomicrobium sp. TaxID=82 RepID=UPI002BE90435|nr:sulfate ABC transporter ATP-binding protein [Hyphomicrobium sp.]HVZ03958.1 sulfate ABC transporter ATP-binding protein [Hyphomicrobium sp.]
MSIEVQGVSKAFGAFKALDNISLNFPDGELVALLGPSGCGKTTLLRVIAGLEHADSGRVILDGDDATDKDVRQRRVGFVFQHYALFRHMTVFENIAFGLRVRPRRERPREKEIRAKVGRLLDLVQLSWVANRFPSQLSGGQRQRIALARALAVEPRVLLLDEPFGALDAKVRKELRRWLRTLHDELHISSIFVTHDQEEALEVSDRIVLVNKGRIEQIGNPKEIYERPATAFAYGFIGAVNEFRGRIEGDYLRVGDERLRHHVEHVKDGQEVVAFVRPHDTEIVTDAASSDGITANINRILGNGAVARIELVASGADRKGRKDFFEVELPETQTASLGLSPGQSVKLRSRRLSIFPDQNGTSSS